MVLMENQGEGVKGETVVTNKINGGLYKIDCQLTNNNGGEGTPGRLHSLGVGEGIRSVLARKNQTPLNIPPPPRKRQFMTITED